MPRCQRLQTADSRTIVSFSAVSSFPCLSVHTVESANFDGEVDDDDDKDEKIGDNDDDEDDDFDDGCGGGGGGNDDNDEDDAVIHARNKNAGSAAAGKSDNLT
jgi:hypothetical protein